MAYRNWFTDCGMFFYDAALVVRASVYVDWYVVVIAIWHFPVFKLRFTSKNFIYFIFVSIVILSSCFAMFSIRCDVSKVLSAFLYDV